MKKEKIKDVIAGIFSIIFIGIVFYLYFIEFFHGTYFYYFDSNNKFVTYEQRYHNSCFINAVEPTIILRMDDVRAYSKLTKPLVDEILNRNISVVLGVIPIDLEKDKNMNKYLNQIKINPYVEIAQHGVYHNETDKSITNDSLIEGYGKIQKVLGVLPVTYILPYNEVSLESREITSNYFRIISGEQGIIKEGEKIAEIGYTEKTYYYDKNESVPIDTIINKCDESLRNTNLCVIAIHPQEYATNINNPTILSEERFEEYKTLLNELQKLNANFSTFNDIVTCSPYNNHTHIKWGVFTFLGMFSWGASHYIFHKNTIFKYFVMVIYL